MSDFDKPLLAVYIKDYSQDDAIGVVDVLSGRVKGNLALDRVGTTSKFNGIVINGVGAVRGRERQGSKIQPVAPSFPLQ